MCNSGFRDVQICRQLPCANIGLIDSWSGLANPFEFSLKLLCTDSDMYPHLSTINYLLSSLEFKSLELQRSCILGNHISSLNHLF
jgi:hypothetical protein